MRDSSVCPSCEGRLFPRELECADCGLQVQTSYRGSEFAALNDDDLHVLRIFIACGGRIRDMETALGVSYPTVKARLATLRQNLGFADSEPQPEPQPEPDESADPELQPEPNEAADPELQPEPDESVTNETTPRSIREVLGRLEEGLIDYDEAMRLIKRVRG